MSNSVDHVREIYTHLEYELRWLIYAASEFQSLEGKGGITVALLDSAAVHGRNLFEFARKEKSDKFTLHALRGTSKSDKAWDRWINNRVSHMLEREHDKAPWPAGLDNDRPDRLMVMAGRVLDLLESGGPKEDGPVRNAFVEVMDAARQYWRDPSEENHQKLGRLNPESEK